MEARRVAEQAERFPADDLRRFVVALLSSRGWTSIDSGAIAAYLLWLDTAGERDLGIATLPDLLERVASGSIKPGAAGRVSKERSAVAVLEAESALPALALIRAGELASQKAGETGLGLVRIVGFEAEGMAPAPVLADLALGPNLAIAFGPGPAWGVAIPTKEGLPVVLDAFLGTKGTKRGKPGLALRDLLPGVGWLAGEESVVVASIQISAIDDVERFRERIATVVDSWDESAGLFLPETLATRRTGAKVNGLSVEADVLRKLRRLAEPHAIQFPSPQD